MPTQYNIDLGMRLRQIRTMRGLSQSNIGDALGVTFQQVQKYEKGQNRLSLENLTLYLHAVGTSLIQFLEDIDQQEYKKMSRSHLNFMKAVDRLTDKERNLLSVIGQNMKGVA